MIATTGTRASSTLISMMPKTNQPWSTFTESIDGWTISVGGQITMLELHPTCENVKRLVRKELSKITISLDYLDIFDTQFYDKGALTFLGRHGD